MLIQSGEKEKQGNMYSDEICMKDPKVSIVIPVYNGANYLGEAIESALAQTYTNCEVIVVNDGSTDNTEEIALSYGDRIRYFAKENGGAASAVNMGISVMDGEYFTWLSHDDIYHPQKVEKSIEALRKSGDMFAPLFGRIEFLMCGGYKDSLIYDVEGFYEEQLSDGTFVGLQQMAHGCTVLFHKDIIKEVGTFNEELPLTQDSEMWFRMFRGRKVVYVDEALVKVRVHEEQDSRKSEAFKNCCQELQMWMLSQIKEEEMIRLHGSKYGFYHERMEYYERCNYYDLYEYAKKIIETLEWPIECEEGIHRLKNKLGLSEGESVCLFCAGRNAKKLIKMLKRRDIEVKYLSDNDESKWNVEIDGIPCVPKDMIEKNACIIVTKDNPLEVKMSFINMGYVNVHTYDEIKKDLFNSYGHIR